MKIIIDNVVFSIQKIGGISVVWYELMKRILDDKELDTNFLESEDAVQNYYRKLLNVKDSSIYSINRKFFSFIRYINPKLRLRTPYVFHSTYYRVSRDKAAINFTTVHDFIYERSGAFDLRTRLHIWQQKQAVLKSDVVVCISENTKRDLLHYYKGVDERKVHVIYNGVSDEYRMLPTSTSLNLPFTSGTYCIYVGVRRGYKNYDLAVRAAAKCGYKMVLVGAPLNGAETQYLDQKLGVGNYICESHISNERLNELYNGAFALLYLSTYEGFGIPCLEAQRAGCPIIACNTSSIPEVCCDPRLLVDELNDINVCKKLLALRDNSYRKEIVEKGIAFADTFSWDKTYEQLRNLYKKAYIERLNQINPADNK